MLKYAVILDDDEVFVGILQEKIRMLFEKYGLEFHIDTFSRPDEMTKNTNIYQLAFMDIMLQDNNGLDIVREWKAAGRMDAVIYISAYEESVFQVFESRPVYFVRKTHLDEDLEKAVRSYQQGIQLSRVIVPEGTGCHIWDASKIIYLQSRGHYIHVFRELGEPSLVRGKMDDMERIFEPHGFVRIQVSYLVNLSYVASIRRWHLQLETGDQYQISRKYRRSLAEKLNLS